MKKQIKKLLKDIDKVHDSLLKELEESNIEACNHSNFIAIDICNLITDRLKEILGEKLYG